jgi:hypothetical protein
MRAAKLLPALALLVVAASGCTIWFLVNQDPAGLACADQSPFCLEGYTCIDGLCLRAAALGEGERCQGDEECQEDLICTNAYDEEECGNFLACEVGRELVADADAKRCHRTCNPTQPVAEQCAVGERCHPDLSGRADGWCQSGTCTTPTECGTNATTGVQNVCRDGNINTGGDPGAGLCVEGCDPLQCNPEAGCVGCRQSTAPDGSLNIMGCEPYVTPATTNCIEAGTVAHDGVCDNNTTFCSAGSFCSSDLTGEATGYCAKWCRPGGGAPACNAAHPTCSPIAGTDFGFCQ